MPDFLAVKTLPINSGFRHKTAYTRWLAYSDSLLQQIFFIVRCVLLLTYLWLIDDILCRRRCRFWHATHDCIVPYVDIILHRGRF